MLREYQQRAIDQLYYWFEATSSGNPCLVLPTGAGKSHIVAALCKDAVQKWPETRILMLTHQKELIEQNSEKMRQHWPNAPMGIYSASVGRRDIDEPITFAGIQSGRNKSSAIGHVAPHAGAWIETAVLAPLPLMAGGRASRRRVD